MHEHFDPYPIDTAELVIQGLGVRQIMPPCTLDRPGGWPHYLLVLFYDPVWCNTPAGTIQLEPGSLVFWQPRVRQSFGNPRRRWNHSWFSAAGRVVQEALRETDMPCDVVLRPQESSSVDRSLIEIYAELKEPAAIDHAIVRNLTANLIRRVARSCDPGWGIGRAPQALADLKRYVDTCFADPMSLDGLAKRAGMSVSLLCLSYKRYYGTPLMAYVRQCRLRHAAMLLRDTKMRILEVALAAGFTDVHHFSKSFKQHWGTSPGASRSGGIV